MCVVHSKQMHAILALLEDCVVTLLQLKQTIKPQWLLLAVVVLLVVVGLAVGLYLSHQFHPLVVIRIPVHHQHLVAE